MARAEQTGLMASLPARIDAAGPEWLVGLRRDAAAHLREHGFPGKKHEAWRFTSVREVVDTPFEEDEASTDALASAVAFADAQLGDDGTWRLVLRDGRPALDAALASSPPSGVSVRSLAEVVANEPGLLEGVLGALAPNEQFAALSSALFSDGVVVIFEEGALPDRPVHLVYVASPGSTPKAAYPRVVVIAREGSQATLVESFLTRATSDDRHLGRHLTSAVSEVAIGRNARLEHVRITEGSERAMQLSMIAVRLDRDAFYGSRVTTLGGALSRVDLRVRFDGPGSEVELDGVYHVDGTDHVDHQVLVDHAAGRCTSHVRYRGLLDGKGHAVFDAMGVVRRDAQQSSAHQENRNLLLSDDATIDTKPHLEIDADDIQASHGATIGAVDETQLFYLRSRGVPESTAKDVLTFAFVAAVVERIGHEPIARRVVAAILDRLPHGDSIRELVD
jgi:Fe-S cluster assembly protein SufD